MKTIKQYTKQETHALNTISALLKAYCVFLLLTIFTMILTVILVLTVAVILGGILGAPIKTTLTILFA